jgi:transcriptional regulator with XRE-family HTH domain
VRVRDTTGISDLDALLGGWMPGDNVVWISDQDEVLRRLESAFLREGLKRGQWCIYASSRPARQVTSTLPDGVELIGTRRGAFADPVRLEEALVDAARRGEGRVALDGLEVLAGRLGWKVAVAFFRRLCPRLFDLGSLAYWRISRRASTPRALEEIRRVTQCVFEVGKDHLRVVKAEGRGTSIQGRLLRLRLDGDTIRLETERARGRLGQGLQRLRESRHLSQTELAHLAGVSPSAISQAEGGHRGLSLDTLLDISEATGVGLDELLANEPEADYVLARRDRTGVPVGQTALLDDPTAGLRTYLIHLRPTARGVPPLQHKGPEMILVAQGLVQVDLGTATPVMRAGDAVLARRVAIKGWRNLLAQDARFFWILRDEVLRSQER